MPDPSVSVILPVYNVAPFVRAAVESVLSQSFADLELIVMDDGSTDGTWKEVARIRDARIVLLAQKHQGAAAARNAAMSHARGRYFAFMDGDDLWLLGKLERDVAYLDAHPQADLIFSAMRMVDQDGHDLGRTIRRWNGVLTFADLLLENMIGSDTVVARRAACEQAGQFDTDLPAASDYDYWLRLALVRPGNLYGSPRVSALYRRRAGQETRDWRQQEAASIRIFDKMQRLRPDEVAKVRDRAMGRLYRALAATAYESQDVASARRLFLRGLKQSPGALAMEGRTWLLGGALISSALLPRPVHEKMEALVQRVLSAQPRE